MLVWGHFTKLLLICAGEQQSHDTLNTKLVEVYDMKETLEAETKSRHTNTWQKLQENYDKDVKVLNKQSIVLV